MKSLLHSKTFWLAVSQAVGGVLVVALTEMEMLGAVLMVKSVMDIWLRLLTSEAIDF